MINRMRRPTDARSAAEAAFKSVTAKAPAAAGHALKGPAMPNGKELVSIRLDREVLEHFQGDGPGWQDRVNAALRKAAGI